MWLVIGLLAFAGIRAILWPPQQHQSEPKADSQTQTHQDEVPEAAAQQVASRYARSYLTWSQDNPKAREDELKRDLPTGADAKAGWNGEGTSLVAQTIPGDVSQTRPHQARVRVDVRVSTTTGTGKNARTLSSWRVLEVPVADSGGRVLVTGQPALVGLEQSTQWQAPPDPETDTAFTASTRAAVTDFLQAWATGTPGQTTAPGATIAPLGAGIKLHSLDGWAAQTGSGSHRTGIATVRWEFAGAELQQTYRITLAQVSANNASRWQVWQVTSQ
ncbi:conjugal transfer protein [Streptomyces noursei]|uniref:conjugal transfer protein n=1 Tax=Streptomyces noursei TaxID=1971 RepID=UPI001E4ECC7F|nr:conjugal transfer protein [Streptomyces noursei]MCZ1021402.1 conjugal transfer protein [Streptomyces noursei]